MNRILVDSNLEFVESIAKNQPGNTNWLRYAVEHERVLRDRISRLYQFAGYNMTTQSARYVFSLAVELETRLDRAMLAIQQKGE